MIRWCNGIFKKTCIIFSLISIFLLTDLYGSHSNSPQKKKAKEELQHKTTVTLKLVQVFVTDKKGNPIMDLGKKDFTLYDNGEQKPITDFEKHVLAGSPETSTQQRKKSPLAPKKMNRKFFILLDFFFNNIKGIRESKKAALHFIDSQLLSTDEVGVLSYSKLKGLTLHQYFTTDHKKVREVMGGFGIGNFLGREADIDYNTRAFREDLESQVLPEEEQEEATQEREEELITSPMLGRITDLTPEEKMMYKQQTIDFIKNIKDLAIGLYHIEGPKHIILFSSGIISSIFTGVFTSDQSDFGDYVLNDRYEDMIFELASANTSVYPIGTEQLISHLYYDRQMLGISSLQRIAEVTGGKYFGNIMDYENTLREIQNVTSSYYILGYYIDEKWDGKYHNIKVKVERKESEVRTQQGYFNPKPFTKLNKLEKKLHFESLALSALPQFKADLLFPLIALPCLSQEKSHLVMISKIPVEGVQMISGKKVEIANLIFDKEGTAVYSIRWEKDFSELPEKDIYYYSLSTLSPGEYKYRVIIRNLETGKAAVASSSIRVPEISDSKISLNPPLLLTPKKNSFYLEGAVIQRKKIGEDFLDLLNLYPYDFSQYSPVVEELEEDRPRLLVVMPCSLRGILQPEIQLFARIIDPSSGEVMPLNFSILDTLEEKDRHIFYISCRLEDLPPGKYSLGFLATEKKTQSQSYTFSTFTIK